MHAQPPDTQIRDRVWDIIAKVGVGMLTTQFAGGLRARPVEPRPDRDAGVLYVVTDINSAKEHEVEASPAIGLSFFDVKENAWLSITGRATVLRDVEKTRAVWHSSDALWWPGGPTDPNVCLLRVEPERAELWDGPASKAVAVFEFVKARLTGDKPNLGENRKVTVKL